MSARRLGLAACAALLLLGCRAEPPRPRNLLLVSLDTVRADRIGAYGRADAGTPFLDALARGGTRFADAMAPAPLTLPSHATLFTGADPLRHGVRHNRLFSLPKDAVTLAERLAGAGLRTGAFVGSLVLSEGTGVVQGFERFSAPESGQARGLFFLGDRPAADVNRDALAWLEEIGDAPFFLFVHYMEPHAPYLPPEPARSEHPTDPYQGEIATVDRALGELIVKLKEDGRLVDTLVIALADHGESLHEHGEATHGIFVYQSTLRVPFLAAGPGVLGNFVVEEPVGLVDLFPTVLDAFGLETPEGLDGRSLWPVMTGTGPVPVRPLYAESFAPRYDFGWSALRVLRSGSDKLIHAPRSELYSLAADPDESADLAGEDPERLAALSAELAERVARIEGEAAAPERRSLRAEEAQALESLGYLAGAHAGEPPSTVHEGGLDPKDHLSDAIEFQRAGELVRLGDLAGAERQLRALLARNPGFVEARARLIVTLVLAGKPADAEEESHRLAQAARALPDGGRVATRGYVLIALAYLGASRLEDAARPLQAALELGDPEAHTLLAAVYHDLGRREDAAEVLARLHAGGGGTERSREMLRYLEAGGALPDSLRPTLSGKR